MKNITLQTCVVISYFAGCAYLWLWVVEVTSLRVERLHLGVSLHMFVVARETALHGRMTCNVESIVTIMIKIIKNISIAPWFQMNLFKGADTTTLKKIKMVKLYIFKI